MDCSIGQRLCTECCYHLTFILQLDPSTFKKHIEFYEARGAHFTQLAASVAITVPSPCPHASMNGCGLEDKKPQLCYEYDCRQDPFLKGGKYYGKKK